MRLGLLLGLFILLLLVVGVHGLLARCGGGRGGGVASGGRSSVLLVVRLHGGGVLVFLGLGRQLVHQRRRVDGKAAMLVQLDLDLHLLCLTVEAGLDSLDLNKVSETKTQGRRKQHIRSDSSKLFARHTLTK